MQNVLSRERARYRYATTIKRRTFLSALTLLTMPTETPRAADPGRIVWPALSGGPIFGGPYHGSFLPGKEGGMVVGGPLEGSQWPDAQGGMIVGGPLNGTRWPGIKGGMIIGGPLNGTVWPPASGGVIVGGPLNGYSVVN